MDRCLCGHELRRDPAGSERLLLGAVLMAVLISAVFRAIIYNPLKVGISGYCIQALNGDASLQALSTGYKPRFLANVWTLFLRDLYVVLWSLLLIVPGIVKTYAYSMTPFILAENPDLSAKEALSRSSAMMKGNKWKTFVLDLSFIGWQILSVITIGILGIFYVNPYVQGTNAELYAYLREDALQRGYVSSNELIGF